ncbi:hypothetical protein D3C76_1465600 [compost metagenome]
MSVATSPGDSSEARTALAASSPTDIALGEECTQPETGRAKPLMSEVSGASYAMWSDA